MKTSQEMRMRNNQKKTVTNNGFTYTSGQSGNSSFHQDNGWQQDSRKAITSGAYKPNSSRNNDQQFHQDGDRYQDARKTISSGAYDSSTPRSILNSYVPTNNTAAEVDYSYPDYTYTGDYGYGSTADGGEVAIDFNAYLDALAAEQRRLQEEAIAEQRRREEEQRAAAQAAYDASKGRLDSAWGDTESALKSNLDSTLDQLRKNYEYGAGVARDDAASSLREAYINHMMNKRNLGQNLAAMGINGGATESTLANLYNEYGNSRNDINKQTEDIIAQLSNGYNSNLASANQLYNSQFADARNNYASQLNGLEQMLANNIMSTYNNTPLYNTSDYAQALSNLQSQMAQLAAKAASTPTTNSLAVNKVTTNNATNTANNNYARYLAMARDLASNKNVSGLELAKYLVANGADQNTIYQIFGVA
jgi:hypothetical protein